MKIKTRSNIPTKNNRSEGESSCNVAFKVVLRYTLLIKNRSDPQMVLHYVNLVFPKHFCKDLILKSALGPFKKYMTFLERKQSLRCAQALKEECF